MSTLKNLAGPSVLDKTDVAPAERVRAARAIPQALETVKTSTLRKITFLERQLRAREQSEKRPLALAKGVQKLRRAAYHANRVRASASRPLAAELQRISADIELHGLDAQLAGDLKLVVGAAVAIEAETGEPVARRIATAVDWFAKPHAPSQRRIPERDESRSAIRAEG
jgi:hypothetical protein